MVHIAILEEKELVRLGIKTIAEQVAQEEIVWYDLQTVQDIRMFLKKNSSGYVFFNPTTYQLLQQVDVIYELKNTYERSIWVMWLEELPEIWLKKMLHMKSVHGFNLLQQKDSLQEIKKGLTTVWRRENYIAACVQEVFNSYKTTAFKVDQILTNAEREILKEIATGKMTKEIAADRNISIHTVITHRKNIFKKLEVNSVHDATRYAIRAGIITVNDYYI
ncbi:response regulator transcription factor [Myroides odoratus]|uniref:Two component system sensor kinase SsrB n=1 Tax=Myroides odoratus TaxID=256 RepID=A0A378U483_MYROD|nr:LuxR C-terminal-related transcriptional regulator [Myroides odoratus]MCS4238918.1 DNA-binding NarL/FixJ family response regulator [Myroides odoratus]MDH6602641.1 NarL family two-component system response regulator LiaR [Myroides gitamensis]QQU03757.1 response regulator transcription factor [Myroides odoratus]STZ68963.1 two component system sensor kinase SsrB [Myroides odoratus]